MSMKMLRFSAAMALLLGTAQAQTPKTSDNPFQKDPSEWNVAIYPIYGWLPLFGADVSLPNFPDLPSLPGGGVHPSGSTGTSLNGAVMSAFRVEKNKWALDGEFLWAGLSADRASPNVHVGLDYIHGQLMVGREIVPHLYLEGGFRRESLDITATVGDYPQVGRKPALWDPLLGISYRKPLGKKWLLSAHLDGGGFGVGSDATIGGYVRADWQFVKHFGATMGFQALHFKVTDGEGIRTLTLSQGMYGPVIGLGIYF
jgi:hypothetical protein